MRGMRCLPLLLALAASGSAQELRRTLIVDPGQVARLPVSPVGLHLEVPGLPEAVAWDGLLRGDGRDRHVDVRVAGEGLLELAWLEHDLDAGSPRELELVLTARDAEPQGLGFGWASEEGSRTLRGEAPVWQHMLAWDPERHDETFRPYTHLYGLHGERLTKGPGGLYPHHRGVFLGWTRTRTASGTHNFWSIPGAPRPHQEHVGWDAEREWTCATLARVAARAEWRTAAGEAPVEEHREWTTRRYDYAPGLTQVVHDYTVTLRARGEEPIHLGGDPAHAGFQVRLAQSVADAKACRYTFPESATGGRGDNWQGCTWVAATFPMGERRYELLFMDHPSNPDATTFNTRDYGRFGPSFFQDLVPGEPLVLRYALRLRELLPDQPHPAALGPDAEHAAWVTPVQARVVE